MLLGNKKCDCTCKYHGLLSGSLQFCACVSVQKFGGGSLFRNVLKEEKWLVKFATTSN